MLAPTGCNVLAILFTGANRGGQKALIRTPAHPSISSPRIRPHTHSLTAVMIDNQ
jgi:hypothetical protein